MPGRATSPKHESRDEVSMRKIQVRITVRLTIIAAVAIALAVVPALAEAQAPGSLAQLAGSNSCIATGESECPTVSGSGLAGSEDVAVSPKPGQNVYVLGETDDSIAEFTRNASDGSLTEIG